MATSNIRIYEAKDSTIIGTSAPKAVLFIHPLFEKFLQDRGYEWQQKNVDFRVPEGNVSSHCVEVRPPMTNEDLLVFGELCVGGAFEEGIVENGHNAVAVIDNRIILPNFFAQTLADGPRIAPPVRV